MSTAFPREAAFLKFEKDVLSTKKKGDHLTAKEFTDCTGMDINSFRGRLHTWERRNNFKLEAVRGNGYRIALDVDHVDLAYRSQRSALKKTRESARTMTVVDHTKLDGPAMRRYEFVMPRLAAQLMRAEQDVKEIKSEFKLTERVPLRELKSVNG